MNFSAEQVVEAFYLAVLNRTPDREGLNAHIGRLKANPAAITSVADDFFHCAEHRSVFGKYRGISDHSQFGEFQLLLKHFIRGGTSNQIIVDIGARGKERSNSFDLVSQFDWKAILIEANPDLYQQITTAFAGYDFTLVKCAVGVTEGTMPFYIGSNDDVSSLIKDAATGWGALRGEVLVDVKRLATILDRLKIPHDFTLLSIDIEGMDIPVLNDLVGTTKYRPEYVIVEASYSFKTKQLSDVGCTKQVQSAYAMIEQTEANLILRRR